jgi:hypothetical protein
VDIDGRAFVQTNLEDVSIEEGHSRFQARSDFIIDVSTGSLVRYSGRESGVVIPQAVEGLVGVFRDGYDEASGGMFRRQTLILRLGASLSFFGYHFHRFVVLRQLKSFATTVSIRAKLSRVLHLKSVRKFHVLETLHSVDVHHF